MEAGRRVACSREFPNRILPKFQLFLALRQVLCTNIFKALEEEPLLCLYVHPPQREKQTQKNDRNLDSSHK